MYAVSPLRYPGAKWRLTQFVAGIIQKNKFIGGHYAEPFAGGASLAISLLLQGYVSEIHLNDYDRSLYAFWKSVTEHTDDLVDLIHTTPVSIASWNAQKEIQRQKGSASLLDLGFSTFFLNRTNRSGILKGGVIGGRAQEGKWKIDARYHKLNLIKRIERIAAFRTRIHVTKFDALEFLRRRNTSLPPKSLVYLDPPYYVKGQNLYLNAYEHDDHEALAKHMLFEFDRPWMVSYDDVKEIRSLYKSVKKQSFVLSYSATSTERIGREIIFFKPTIKVPRLLLPGY